MTGLRSHVRDPELPARAGEPELVPPTPDELLARVQRELVLPGGPRPVRAELDYARWKPGVSITAGYRVTLADGREEQVQLKRYAGDKARYLVGRLALDPRLEALCQGLRPVSVDAGAGTLLWVFPADRVLEGLWSLHDPRRVARLLDGARDGSGAFGDWRVRKRKTRLELLRYKPERRAVYRVDLGLRCGEARRPARVAARVLPPSVAAAVARARRELAASGDQGLQPELLVHEPRTGILLERWIEELPAAPDAFDHAVRAGRALARLHARPVSPWVPRRDVEESTELRRLLASEPELARLADDALAGLERSRAALTPGASADALETWVHGDFHPDQVALAPHGEAARLLDFDRLGRGDPARDLAGWIADHLVERPEARPADAAAPLLEGYRAGGGRAIGAAHLAATVADELARRAAAGFRRLERDAAARARRALERAVALVGEGALAP